MVFGTPEYMAPEQARGDPVDERTDVYAVGVMFYEMLTGRVPFRASSPIAVMTAHLTQAPDPPSKLAPDRAIVPALEAVVMHALAKQPEARYPNAAVLAAALRNAICHPSDVASTAPPPADDRDDIGNRDTENALQITAALRPTEPLSLTPPSSAPASDASDASGRLWVWVALLAAAVGVAAGVIVSMVGTG